MKKKTCIFLLMCFLMSVGGSEWGCASKIVEEARTEVQEKEKPTADNGAEKGGDAGAPDTSSKDTALQDRPVEKVAEAPKEEKLLEPYFLDLFQKERINSTGQVNVRSIKKSFFIKGKQFSYVGIEIDLESTCYPFEKWRTNPPPQGHNWPSDCDAYDRNFSFYLNPLAKDEKGPPPYELVRAITPFGGPMKIKLDITDIINYIPKDKEHTISSTISTYSDANGKVSGSNGGWTVTARLVVVPGIPPRKVLAAIPLVSQSYTNKTGKPEIEFTVPDGTKSMKLDYTVTGHGGGKVDVACIGHADEFCKRTHHVYVDDKEVFTKIPWRTDCKDYCTLTKHPFNSSIQYCKENPCGAISSVRAPRANWCPGRLTFPFSITSPLDGLAAGKHKFSYKIDEVADGGSWKVSAVLFAYGE